MITIMMIERSFSDQENEADNDDEDAFSNLFNADYMTPNHARIQSWEVRPYIIHWGVGYKGQGFGRGNY